MWIGLAPHAQPDHIIELFSISDDDWLDYPFTNEVSFVKSVPIELAGSGDTATEFFTLTEGFAVFEMEHTGSRILLCS